MKDVCTGPQAGPNLIGVNFHPADGIDKILVQVARELRNTGYEVAGLVQEKGGAASECDCRDMFLRDLQTDTCHIISERRGKHARGCHLDWAALAEMSNGLLMRLDASVNVLIVNRFGQAESDGKGLREAITKALELGCLVVVAYRDEYRPGWEAFHDGFAQDTPADLKTILNRCLVALGAATEQQDAAKQAGVDVLTT